MAFVINKNKNNNSIVNKVERINCFLQDYKDGKSISDYIEEFSKWEYDIIPNRFSVYELVQDYNNHKDITKHIDQLTGAVDLAKAMVEPIKTKLNYSSRIVSRNADLETFNAIVRNTEELPVIETDVNYSIASNPPLKLVKYPINPNNFVDVKKEVDKLLTEGTMLLTCIVDDNAPKYIPLPQDDSRRLKLGWNVEEVLDIEKCYIGKNVKWN